MCLQTRNKYKQPCIKLRKGDERRANIKMSGI